MSCLVIKNDGIGDLILASGIITSLAKHFGSVDLVTCQDNAEIASCIPGVNRVFYLTRDGIRYRAKLLKLGISWPRIPDEDRTVLREIRCREYTVAISLRRYIRQSTLVVMQQIKATRKYCCWLFPTNIDEASAERLSRGWSRYSGQATGSEAEYYGAFLKQSLGFDATVSPYLKIPPTAPKLRPVSEKPAIGLVLGGAIERWPAVRWLELAAKLSEVGERIVLLGGKDCEKLANEIALSNPLCTNLVGRLSHMESVPWLAALDLVIANDTGFAHFGSLVCQRIMVIMGGGGFTRFFPWPAATNQYIIYRAMGCYDCTWECSQREKECLTGISATDVFLYHVEILKDSNTARMKNLTTTTIAYSVAWRHCGGRRTAETKVI